MPTCMRYAQPMTDELFREDAALDICDARITILGEAGIELDRTVFYPQGSGQAGDRGEIRMADGRVLVIADTKKGATDGAIVHLPAPGQEALLATLSVDMPVRAAIDRTRRRRHKSTSSVANPGRPGFQLPAMSQNPLLGPTQETFQAWAIVAVAHARAKADSTRTRKLLKVICIPGDACCNSHGRHRM